MGKTHKDKPAYMRVRKTWTRNPVTKVKGDKRKEQSRKACRGKVVAQ